ncbi:MAG TPA: cysteine--tRNA ligase [Chromatiales bacterium]|nr:cysteine--tRNA ligase [Chromatiales bacterium]
MLQIYNTLNNKKERFIPIEPGKVRMYVCGMTVYDYCHVGHARVLVVFDVIARYLRESGYELTYVRNITDIDDKIIARAHENGEPIEQLTSRFIAAMREDAAALGVLPPDMEPCATTSMAQIIQMIETLVEKGYAYAGDNGDVYYDVSRFASYGQLSGKRTEELRAGERIDVNSAKTDPLDFVLWKSAKPDEPSWASPWGNGRPGWHIECSAMSTDCLGDHFDIHGGGLDLQFPHHENEIAQSEAATGCQFVNYWIHNGFVQINEEKMSKSLGNFFTLREVLKTYAPEVIRYFILASHYRSPLNYADQNLDGAKLALERFYTALRGIDAAVVSDGGEYQQRFCAAMDDDFNTPEALAVLFEIVTALNRARADQDAPLASQLAGNLRYLAGVIGLLQGDAEAFLKGSAGDDGLSDEQIETLIQQRIEAKQAKQWGEADRIRDELQAQGVIVEDGAGGSRWRRV